MTTVWTPSAVLNTDDTNDGSISFRVNCKTISSGAAQVRVTFRPNSAASFQVDHASIAKVNSATAPNCDATPVELLFSGVSGFTASAGVDVVSDWLTFSTSTSDNLMVVMDVHSTNGNPKARLDGTETNCDSYHKAASTSFNLATVSGFTAHAGFDWAIALIEVQGTADNLMAQSIF